MNNKTALLFLFSFFSASTSVKCQVSQIRFKHYTTNDGLSQGDVYHIFQDSRGFMWFSTFDGLNRFDGYNFKVFRPQNNDSNSITGGFINSIIEDKNNILWIGTNEALNSYDYKTGYFKHYNVQDSRKQNIKTNYNPFFIDDKSELWFSYETNLASMNLVTGKFTKYPFADGVMQGCVSADYPDKKFYRHLSKIYTTHIDGLHIIDLDNRETQFYFSSNTKNILGTKTVILQALEDKNHTLWLGSVNGLMSFDLATNQTQLYNSYNNNKVANAFFLTQDENDNIWCGGGNGLFLFNKVEKKFIRNYTKKFIDPESISDNGLTSLFIDNSNNLWIGVDPVGIDKINPSYEQLGYVKINPENNYTYYTSSIWSIAELDSVHLLVSSNHHDLILFNKTTDVSKKINLPPPLKKSYQNNFVLLDSKKRIWVASDSGLFCSDDFMKTFELVDKHNFSGTYLFENKKRIFVGTGNGLYALYYNNHNLIVDTLHLFDGKSINFIGKSKNEFLTVATSGKEFFLIDLNGNKIELKIKKTFNFMIKSICIEDDNTIWFGTNTGLAKFTWSNKSLRIFTEKDGLANNFIYCVIKGNDGNLWMSTNHGISKFDLTTEHFSNYGLAEGVQSLEFNTHSFFQSPSGMIYFGGVKGFNYFDPSKIKNFEFAPPLEILNISVNGNPISPGFLHQQTQPVKFLSDENNIMVEYAALDFNRNDNINYLYNLDNRNNWISNGNNRTINFANLSPGTYNLKIAAQYSYNNLSPKIAKFTFIILPPFYKTIWFTTLILTIILFIIYSIYKYRITQILKLQTLRNKIARDLHDEIGSTLSSISVYSEVAKNRASKNENETEVLQKIGTAARELIEKMSDIVWSLNPNNESFEQLKSRMVAFAAMMLTPKGILFEFDADEESKNIQLTSEQRKNIFLIYKESINNIVKYSEASSVGVKIKVRVGKLIMEVSDNGKGFDTINATAYNGNGLKNMKARAEDLKAELKIDSKINAGTYITLNLNL